MMRSLRALSSTSTAKRLSCNGGGVFARVHASSEKRNTWLLRWRVVL